MEVMAKFKIGVVVTWVYTFQTYQIALINIHGFLYGNHTSIKWCFLKKK